MKCVLELDRYARNFISQVDAKQLGFGRTRIGVHTGMAVVGNFGGDAFFDYTAHGDVINTASRLENANKHLGTTICLSGETKSRCKDILFRPVGQLLLKGKTGSIETFEPLLENSPEYCEISVYHEAYHLLDSEKNNAAEVFLKLARQFPGDPLVQMHASRLARGESGSVIVLRNNLKESSLGLMDAPASSR
jgi:adenylate cyclase